MLDFVEFFARLRQHLADVCPIHPGAAGFLAEFLRAHHRGQAAADVPETLCAVLVLARAFLLFDLLPIFENSLDGICARVAINVRMPPDEFFRGVLHDRRDVELRILGENHTGEHALRDNVTKFLRRMR